MYTLTVSRNGPSVIVQVPGRTAYSSTILEISFEMSSNPEIACDKSSSDCLTTLVLLS